MALVPASILRAATAAAATHRVDLPLFLAIGHVESVGWTRTIGDLDAGISLGSWQVNLNGAGHAYRGNPERLLETETNADVAAGYLRACLDAFPGDEDRAILAYNTGVSGAGLYTPAQAAEHRYVMAVRVKLAWYRDETPTERWDADVPEAFQQYGKTAWDCMVVLKAICDDALEAGRVEAAELREIAQKATDAETRWGTR